MFAIYDNQTGELRSTGTIVSSDLPPNLTVIELTDEESASLASGAGIWDTETMQVVANPNYQSDEFRTIPLAAILQFETQLQNGDIDTISDLRSSILSFLQSIKG